ncbi:MAG: ROK family protein [Oscillospiraceae bacterium]|jgi:glucokinase|nr:ROK family protein [Oscillospiraceae bacterium]
MHLRSGADIRGIRRMSGRGYTVGIDVGGTKTAYGLFDADGKIIARRRHPSDAKLAPEPFFDRIIGNINALCAEAGVSAGELRGVGAGMPSFVRAPDGCIIRTANLPLIRDFPALEYLERGLGGIRAAVGNDMHVGALAEHRYGAGRGRDNMLYCLLSTGISSGIIIGGKLFRGSRGFSGESGHMIVTPGEGPECGCGNRGCVSAYASASKIPEHIRQWIEDGEETSLTEPFSTARIAEGWKLGDRLAVRAVEQMTLYMAVWLFNLYITLNIDCFVFGGGLLNMELPLLDMVREKFDGFDKAGMPVEFKTTELGEDFGIIGAAELLRA